MHRSPDPAMAAQHAGRDEDVTEQYRGVQTRRGRV
jgi:hypothetical protein